MPWVSGWIAFHTHHLEMDKGNPRLVHILLSIVCIMRVCRGRSRLGGSHRICIRSASKFTTHAPKVPKLDSCRAAGQSRRKSHSRSLEGAVSDNTRAKRLMIHHHTGSAGKAGLGPRQAVIFFVCFFVPFPFQLRRALRDGW